MALNEIEGTVLEHADRLRLMPNAMAKQVTTTGRGSTWLPLASVTIATAVMGVGHVAQRESGQLPKAKREQGAQKAKGKKASAVGFS